MNNEYVGVIRRGWQEAATTLAPHVGGMGDVLERRLEEAIRTGSLDETTLLRIVDDATQMAVDAGSDDVAHTLSKRLRRTVYEYLLSLDATGAQENDAPLSTAPVNPPGAVLIGADEVAALARMPAAEAPIHQAHSETDSGSPEPARAAGLGRGALTETAAFSPVSTTDRHENPDMEREPEHRRLYLFHGSDDHVSQTVTGTPAITAPDSGPPLALTHDAPTDDPGTVESITGGAGGSLSLAPGFGFHIGDPNDLVGQVPQESQVANQDDRSIAFPDDFDDDVNPTPATGVETPERPRASFADPSTWPKPVTPSPHSLRSHDRTETDADDPSAAGAHRDAGLEHLSRWSTPWPASTHAPSAEALEPAPVAPSEPPVALEGQPVAETDTPHRPNRAPETAPEAEAVPLIPEPPSPPAAVDDLDLDASLDVQEVPESDLSELRRAIDEKLRKKRCDDAASLLQQVAQELGGRLVAEMALDAGDRCRALGKANAALNCYLAASRADPIYEAPLARLADICIDDQDIDLAVSYLERIARLTRLRGDNKGALRIYRKIATIAPYRDDVLEMLMRAQTTGRFDS